jgi:hypothetical protein
MAVNCDRLTIALLSLLFAGSLAEQTAAQTISGQVFIVTRAHETVKLALVPIEIYRADDVEAAITAVDASLQADRERMASFNAVVDAQYKTAELASELLSKAVRDSYSVPRLNAAESGAGLEHALSRLQLAAAKRNAFLNGGAKYFARLRKDARPVASTKSDADGKFVVPIPDSGRFAIAASAQRETPNTVELYSWLVRAEPQVNLTNENLTETDDQSSFLKRKRDDPLADPSMSEASLSAMLNKIKTDYADVIQAIADARAGKFKARVVTTRTRLQTPRGEIIVDPGTVLQVISIDGDSLTVSSVYGAATIPLSATEIKN